MTSDEELVEVPTRYNCEPEHNTNSILCWCAPRFDGSVVVHRTVAELMHEARLEGARAALRSPVSGKDDEEWATDIVARLAAQRPLE